jgi:hypothetical protein
MNSYRVLVSLAVLLAVCGAVIGCKPAARGPWTVAYTANLQNAKLVDEEWVPRWCEPKVADGKLVVPPDKRRGHVAAFYDGLRFPGSVRVELTGSVSTTKGPGRLSFGICMSSDGYDSGTGYVFQFGAKGNRCSLLRREAGSYDSDVALGIHDGSHLNKGVDATAGNTVQVEAGKTYHIVAERDGGKLSLWVDGTPVFSYDDPQPVKGPDRCYVGLVSQDCTLSVEKFVVFTRAGRRGAVVGPAQPPKGPEVTVKGVVVCSRATTPQEDAGDHTLLLYAYDGTPEIRSELDQVMEKYYPADHGLNVEEAQKVQEEFDKRLRYSIADCHLARQNHSEPHWCAQTMAVTGVVFERDGKRWIYPTGIKVASFSPAQFRQDPTRRLFTFPARMVAPDKPFAVPGKTPLVLKINDALSLKCILLPAGSFVQGSPFYQSYRWQDEYPHEVVMTKPFYMSEHPITQEMFEAVMGKNPSIRKGPKFPVEQVPYTDIEEFCQILSERTGRTVRVPTDAEWEYAARVGTSSPCFTEKYLDQLSRAGDAIYGQPQPVKSKPPNAWGIHDMISGGWHVVSDWAANNSRVKQVDQKGPGKKDPTVRDYGNGIVHKAKGGEYYDDWRPSMHGAVDDDGKGAEGNTLFNVVVEAEK